MASSPVIILGMNRSGTSYLSSVVASWGVNVGDELLDPIHTNPHGFFEDKEFVAFHESVLSAKQKTRFPDDNCIVPECPHIELNCIERMGMEALIARKEKDDLWGWKDPRTCMFSGIWLKRFPEAKLICIYRHPLEVYSSILRRHHEVAFLDDLAVIKAWKMANEKLLEAWEMHKGPKIMLGANPSVLKDKVRLMKLLSPILGKDGCNGKNFPAFHENEFGTMNISAQMHGCFSVVFPGYSNLFEKLQSISSAKINFPVAMNEDWNSLAKSSSEVDEEYRAPFLSAMATALSPDLAKRRYECSLKLLDYIHDDFTVTKSKFRDGIKLYAKVLLEHR